MRPLAFKLVPWEIMENSGILWKIIENLNFATWRKVFSNFVGPPQLNREERSGFFSYWTTMDKLEFTDWSQVNRMNGCGEKAIFRWRKMFVPPPPLSRVKVSLKLDWQNIPQFTWWLLCFHKTVLPNRVHCFFVLIVFFGLVWWWWCRSVHLSLHGQRNPR